MPNCLINAPLSLWIVLAIPWCYFIILYVTGAFTYGQFILASGDWSAWLLMATLAITPIKLMFPNSRWSLWLLQRRRYFGVASFMYAAPHVGAYLIRLPTDRVLSEMVEPGIMTGWLALAIFLPLAVTSNNAAVRALGRRWKSLHRLVYIAAVLTFAHWIITAFDPLVGAINAGVLAALEVYRVWKQRMS